MTDAILYREFVDGLKEMEEAYNQYVPISEYQMIFEDGNPKVQQQANDNTKAVKKGDNAFMKVIKSLKAMIHNVIETIKNFITELRMDEKEREAFERFKAACKQDPSLKNKKVTIRDFRAINAQYDKLINETEARIREVKANENTPVEDLINKISSFFKKGAMGVASAVSADLLLKGAVSNREFAQILHGELQKDNAALDALQDAMGEAQAKHFQKDIKRYSSESKLYGWLIRLRKEKFNSFSQCLKAEIDAINDITKGKLFSKNARGLTKQALHNQALRDTVIDSAKDIAKDAVGSAVKGSAKHGVRNIFSRNDKYVKHQKNYPVHNDGETTEQYQQRVEKWKMKNNKYEKSEAKSMERQSKHFNSVNKSAGSFLAGKF